MEAFSYTHLTKLTISIPSFLLTENVCTSPSFAYCNVLSSQSTGGLQPRRIIFGRALQKDELSVHNLPVSQTVNKDRLIALFSRIQESISQGKSQKWSDTRSQLSTDDSSVETSVVEFLSRSNSKQANPKHSKQSTQKGRKPKKEKLVPDSQYSSGSSITRPPSNFVKKSPIPLPAPSTSNEFIVADGEGSSSEARNESEKFGEMKVNELKVLAKERGLKGYSKLKKSELIELLKFHV
ncbi:hypothetical protein vseg_007320 [Gypsophila vaccaria]